MKDLEIKTSLMSKSVDCVRQNKVLCSHLLCSGPDNKHVGFSVNQRDMGLKAQMA